VLRPNILNQVSNPTVKRVGDASERGKTRIRKAALNFAEISDVNRGHIGEINLANAKICAQSANTIANNP